MAAGLTTQAIDVPTKVRLTRVTVICDAAYPTGGYDLSTVVPVGSNVFGFAAQRYTTASQLVPIFDPTTRKLALYESSTGAPLALVECAASSAHVTTSTIVDVLLVSF